MGWAGVEPPPPSSSRMAALKQEAERLERALNELKSRIQEIDEAAGRR